VLQRKSFCKLIQQLLCSIKGTALQSLHLTTQSVWVLTLLKLRQSCQHVCILFHLAFLLAAKDATRKADRESDNLGSKAKNAVDDAAGNVKSALRDAKGSGKNLADDAERNVKNAADDVENNADGLGSKIKHAAGDAKDAVGDAANAIKHKGE
jgi:hypothetical protein